MKQIIMQIKHQSTHSYPIKIAVDLLNHFAKWLPNNCHDKRFVIITDDQVKMHYGDHLAKTLKDFKPLLLSFVPGEESKNYETKQKLEEQMIVERCDRETVILALGGGVVGDMAGFIAATYMRGIPYIQIPTSLLAMVDSSIGGKTGINTIHGKNLIGAFWQPSAVVIDMTCLMSLSQTHLINGLIEALKMFLTSNKEYFTYTHNKLNEIINRDITTLQNIVHQAIKIKTQIVSEDEKENNLRMVLNFGHTIGHALEKVTHYKLLHGHAVLLGILVEAKISQLLGILSAKDYQIIEMILSKLNFSADQLKQMNSEEIIKATKIDKKVKIGHVRYILLKEIGQVYSDNFGVAHAVSDDIVRKALLEVKRGVK